MEIRVYDDFDAIPLTAGQWNRLARQSGVDTIFQTHEWSRAWWKTFGKRRRFLGVAVHDDERLVGLAPLMSGSVTGSDWHFLADANSDYCDFPAEGNRYAALERLMRFFAQDYGDWTSLTLRNIPERSPSIAALVTLCEKHGLCCRLSSRIAAPALRFGHGERGPKLKYSVRRHSNRLERLGTVEFQVVERMDELPQMLDILFRQHRSRFRDKGERSLFEDSLCREFYAALAGELLASGWLHFSRLTLDGVPLAVHFGFEYNRVLTWYKPAFDIAYRQYSPGTVLITQLIEYAQKSGLQALDFSIGDEEFKNRFSNSTSYNRHVVVYKSRTSAHLHALEGRALAILRRTKSIFGGGYAPG